MRLFHFGKAKDDILKDKLQKLTNKIDSKKSELKKLQKQLNITSDILHLDGEIEKRKNKLEN